jgi:hypothetical protein
MEDFSLALLEDGQELGSSHGLSGKLMSNEGFSLWIVMPFVTPVSVS